MEKLISKLKSRIQLLEQIQSDDQRLWGVMHPQNLMEHLGGIFLMSAKGMKSQVVVPPDQAKKMKSRFFGSYYPFARNVKIPGTQDAPAEAPPFRFASLEESREKLNKAVQLFFHNLNENPEQTATHGYFGDLSLAEWLAFHIKHVEHHLEQFGIIGRDENIPVIEKLLYKIRRDVQADTPAVWGKMNAHQMIEHLGLVFALSMGKINFPDTVDADQAAKNWEAFQQAENPWKEVFPPTNYGDPRPTRTDTIEAAKAALTKTFKAYLDYGEVHPDAVHPQYFLGQLSIPQWREVHVKHLKHHARQFGMEV